MRRLFAMCAVAGMWVVLGAGCGPHDRPANEPEYSECDPDAPECEPQYEGECDPETDQYCGPGYDDYDDESYDDDDAPDSD